MSWLNWFSRDSKQVRSNSRDASPASHAAKGAEGRRPSGSSNAGSQPAALASSQRLEQRRTERNAKRELLFQVVRESMVRVGVLSSAFRFKVLSLDQRGRSFLVMIELSAEFNGETEKLAEIESMIAQTARHRFDIVVQAVYWRYFNTSSPNSVPASAPAPLLGAMHAPISRPAPLFPLDGTAAITQPRPIQHPSTAPSTAFGYPASSAPPARVAPPPAPTSSTQSHDELSEEEVAAFRRALTAGAAQGMLAASVSKESLESATNKPDKASTLDTARNKLLLTGYEDTEMADDDPIPALSGTQYGELR
jgi:hypothetical protein